MAKYVIVKMLQNQAIGSVFNSGQWPLHVTIIPNFEIEWDFNKLKSELGPVISTYRQVKTVATTDALFGPDKNIPVTRFELKPELAKIHTEIVEFLESNGAKFELPIISKENYKPHATIQKSARITVGEDVTIDELCIVDKEANSNPNLRKVLGIVKLTK
jgi:2'-5' RNA ligase